MRTPPWRPHYRGTLAGRITLLTTIAVGLAVTAVSLAAYLTIRSQSISSLDDSLRTRAQAASHFDSVAELAQEQIPAIAYGASDTRIALVDANLGLVYRLGRGNRLSPGAPEEAVAQGKRAHSVRTVIYDGKRYRMVAVPGDPDGTAVVLAQSLEPTDQMLSRLGLVTLFFGLAGVLAAGLAGWAVARNGLRPVRRLTSAAEDIARTEKLDPIPVEGNDEIARLSAAFNAMLGSLSASRDRQRQLVADAGHELRTPLTSLRTNLDLLAQAGDRLGPEARRDLIDDVRAQISELTTLIGDLVELAREEPLPSTPQTVDLVEVVDHAVTRVRRRAPGLVFEVHTEPWFLVGDATALERAVTNLLDNAAKWSPPGGTVTTTLRDGSLTVADEGPGIAEEDLPHVFERFYRSTESRGMPGSGLGLSIVHAVAERHGGDVHAGAAPSGGASMWLRLPGWPGQPDDDAAARGEVLDAS